MTRLFVKLYTTYHHSSSWWDLDTVGRQTSPRTTTSKHKSAPSLIWIVNTWTVSFTTGAIWCSTDGHLMRWTKTCNTSFVQNSRTRWTGTQSVCATHMDGVDPTHRAIHMSCSSGSTTWRYSRSRGQSWCRSAGVGLFCSAANYAMTLGWVSSGAAVCWSCGVGDV